MATDISDIINSIWADGPSLQPYEPPKSRIRQEFGQPLQAIIDQIRGIISLGLQLKDPVRAATAPGTNVDLATISNGASFGGVTVATGDRIGAFGQTTASQNGILVVQASGAPVRATDADASLEMLGMTAYVLEGTNGGKVFSCIAPPVITPNVTALPFVLLLDMSSLNAAIASLQAAIVLLEAADVAIDAKVPDIAKQSGIRDRHVTGTKRNQQYQNDVYGPFPWKTWFVGIAPPHNVQDPSAIGWWLVFAETPAQIGHRVVERDWSVGNGGPSEFIFPGDYPTDVILRDITWYDAIDVIKDPDIPTQFQHARFPVDGLGPFRTGKIYWTQVFAKNAAGERIDIGCAYGRPPINDTIDPLWKKGIGSQSTTLGADSFGVGAGMIAVALYESVYVPGDTGTDVNPMHVAFANPKVLKLNQAVTSGSVWAVTTPIFSVDTQPAPVAGDSLGEYIAGVSKVTATGRTRYDVMTQDPDTGGILIAQGTERGKDANEYIPDVKNFPVVANLRVHYGGVEIIKRTDFEGFMRIGQEGRFMAWLERNRRLMSNTMMRLRRGLPIRLIGYGDSITAIGGDDPYIPNGAGRDRIEYLVDYPSDTLASIPRYAGDNGPTGHVHIGHNWQVKDAMERRWGSIVEYLNMGIGGTTSFNTFVDGIGPNGLYPARLNALKAQIIPSQTLVVISFGMNELSTPATYTNLVQIANEVISVGGEVLMTTCMRPGRINGPWVNTDWWLSVCTRTVRAAYSANVAYADSAEIFGPGNEGAVGLSKFTLCNANGSNHPGAYELRKFGEYMSLAFT